MTFEKELRLHDREWLQLIVNDLAQGHGEATYHIVNRMHDGTEQIIERSVRGACQSQPSFSDADLLDVLYALTLDHIVYAGYVARVRIAASDVAKRLGITWDDEAIEMIVDGVSRLLSVSITDEITTGSTHCLHGYMIFAGLNALSGQIDGNIDCILELDWASKHNADGTLG